MTNPDERPDGYADLYTMSSQRQRRAFADMARLYPTRTVRAGTSPAPLALGTPVQVRYEAEGGVHDLHAFMRRYCATALLILKRGRIMAEHYAEGHSPTTRWISFSMAKSVSATLVGAALQDGLIASLDEPVSRTVPTLSGSAYDGVSIRHVLQMSSGVRWNETYLDPASDRRKLLALQAAERPGVVLEYLSRLPRAAEPGTTFNYNTAETFLVGAIVRGATGRPLADYLSEKVWQPCGMEADAYWQLESPGGEEFAGSGLSATLRDYGRFGLFVLGDGVVAGRRVLAPGFIAAATSTETVPRLAPGQLADYQPLGYGYQWWTFASRRGHPIFGALGIFGQQIYIDVAEELVIVVNGAWPDPLSVSRRLESYLFFAATAAALRGQ